MPNEAPTSDATWQKWHDEFEAASKAKGYQQWQTRAKKIIKRYRDDRGDGDGASDGMTSESQFGSRFNILWSNVQTLMPALFAKTPKPVVERRYLDRDDVGRTASVILERALLYELDEGDYQSSLRKAVLDRLLPGRGVVWVRYEPKFVPMAGKTQTEKGDAEPKAARSEENGDPDDAGAGAEGDEELAKPDETEQGEEVASESTCVDYVDWTDFQTSPARTWEEVWWISKRVYMTRAEMKARKFKRWADVPLDWSPSKNQKVAPGTTTDTGDKEGEHRAKILEVWDKTNRKVYWMAESWGEEMLDEKDDPLKLEGFWPVPEPLFATLTNDSLVPVPDYYEYQDQAVELDDLTNRISWLTKAIKACGVYDASIPELQRMWDEGFENRLVPADNMAEFASKMGASGMGAMWLMPVKDMVFTLNELYKARNEVKQSLYEVTGISDIVRGAAQSGGAKTATEQRIKGQFASMRLNDMQAEVARFARDTLRIMGEIISEHFDPMTLYLVSGFEQYAKEQWPPEPPMPPQGGQPPMMGHNGGPPMNPGAAAPPPPPGVAQPAAPAGQPVGAAPMPQPMHGSMGAPMLPPDPVLVAQQKAAAMFKAAVGLLKNDKLRGFRIDIETDSLIEPDQQQTQQARTELLGAIAQFLPQAIQAGMAMPELKPLLARLLMFFLRGFKASRDIEAAFGQFVDDMTKEAANPKPKPPSPEQQKAEAELQKQQMENQRIAAQAKIDQMQAQQDFAIEQQKAQMELQAQQAELQLERERLDMERQKMAMQLQHEQQIAAIKGAAAERDARIDQHAAGLDVAAMECKHELGLETMAAKAKQAKTNGTTAK